MVDLFDRVKQGIDKGVTVVSVKSKEMMEVAKIKNQLSVLRNQRESAFSVLGEIVYQMYLQNSFNEEKIRNKCEVIALITSQIHEKEGDLKELHLQAEVALGKSFCTTCDSELPVGAMYCSKCGEKIEAIEKH
jgi:ribosomal protein L40E